MRKSYKESEKTSKTIEVIPTGPMPQGRPIVKGGLPMQMAANVELQMRDQYLRKQQLSMGQLSINNPAQAMGSVMQQSQQQQHNQPQPSSQQPSNQLPNLSQQQQQQMQHLLQHRQQQQRAATAMRYQTQYQQMMHTPHASQLNQQQKPSGSGGQSGNGELARSYSLFRKKNS